MIAALLAALMGGMASVFNSTSTLVTLDFYKKLRPKASEKQLVLIGRAATAVMVVLGIAWVPLISRISGQLYIYLQVCRPTSARRLPPVHPGHFCGHGSILRELSAPC